MTPCRHFLPDARSRLLALECRPGSNRHVCDSCRPQSVKDVDFFNMTIYVIMCDGNRTIRKVMEKGDGYICTRTVPWNTNVPAPAGAHQAGGI